MLMKWVLDRQLTPIYQSIWGSIERDEKEERESDQREKKTK